MSEHTALAEIHDAPGQLARRHVDTESLMRAALDKGPEAVAALEKLVMLHEHQQDREAKQAFARAFMALQESLPTVVATREVTRRGGGVMFKFANLEDIVNQITPCLRQQGFAISFSMESDEKRIVAVCHLMHVDGHSEQRKYAVRLGQSLHDGNTAQNDAATSTYAKRAALCAALNIITSQDRDVRQEGGFITPEDAEELERRACACGSDIPRLLKFAEASDFHHIRKAKAKEVEATLARKEREQAGRQTQATPRPAAGRPNVNPAPATDPAVTEAKREALEWSENTPEAVILEALGSNASSAVVKAKAQATASGPMEDADSTTLRRIAYFWKLNQLQQQTP